MIDVSNAPKPAYWGLKRAFKPVTVILTDENLNGLAITLINETPLPRRVALRLTCLRDGETIVMNASVDLTLEPRRSVVLAATTVWGGFFDTTYAFRFGEPSHDVTMARLVDADSGIWIADAFHFPLGRGHARQDLGLTARLIETGETWTLSLTTRRFAQSIRISGDPSMLSDNWFHLSPGAPRDITLKSKIDGERPILSVRALNDVTDIKVG